MPNWTVHEGLPISNYSTLGTWAPTSIASEAHITNRVAELVEASSVVISDARQVNGAIVAANPRHQAASPEAVDYGYMWLRDAAENLRAAHAANLAITPDLRQGIVGWINDTMPSETPDVLGPKTAGKREHVSGGHDASYYSPAGYQPPEWQPDNNALMVAALLDTSDGPLDTQTFSAVRSLCQGLVNHWDSRSGYFTGNVENQWENHIVQDRHFTHTIVAGAYALTAAGNFIPQKPTSSDIKDMATWRAMGNRLYQIFEAEKPYASESPGVPYHRLLRAEGRQHEYNPLDSGVTLVLPAFLRPETPEHVHERAANTIQTIGRLLLSSGLDGAPMGTYRYRNDTYDGIYRPNGAEAGAGSWPLLLFSHSLALRHIGDTTTARRLFLGGVHTLDRLYQDGVLPDNLIPEQVFPDGDKRQGRGIIPLVWSHGMFLRAASALGYISDPGQPLDRAIHLEQ